MLERERFAQKRRLFFIRAATLLIPIICGLMLLSQTVFAQNTYVITDGGRVLIHTTSATDPAAVLNEAGLELDEDDTYTAQPGFGVSEITIQRSQTVHIDNCGQRMEVISYGETVDELLARLSITPDEETQVSHDLKEYTYDGMDLTISRVIRSVETYTTSIPHETTKCFDSTLPAGTQVVLTAGSDGEMTCTANVVYVNGEETSRTLLSQTVAQQPVTEVLAVGTNASRTGDTGTDAPIIGENTITLPTGEVLTYSDVYSMGATAYHCEGYTGITATGTIARVGAIAVDPSVIPYGTRMFIVTKDGQYVYGIATAEDTGHPDFICGNRIDLFFDTEAECIQFGYRECWVYILGETKIQREYWGTEDLN